MAASPGTPSGSHSGSQSGRPPGNPRVLVLARESVIAALLGMLLELEGYEPAFAEPGERPDDAIRRLRPPLVVMLDGGVEESRSDLFHARAAQAGARIVLFSEPVDADAVREAARARGVPFLHMPTTREALGQAMAAAMAR
jgi:DNA-binding NtrC family response regulator